VVLKLFQIEEPDGTPNDPDMPGAAIGIDASGRLAEVAFAVGGNAVILADREGFERELPVPPLDAPTDAWQALFEGARLRAERSLARPVTHAAVALADAADGGMAMRLATAGMAAGVSLLRLVSRRDIAAGEGPAAAAAIIAEDMAPTAEGF